MPVIVSLIRLSSITEHVLSQSLLRKGALSQKQQENKLKPSLKRLPSNLIRFRNQLARGFFPGKLVAGFWRKKRL
jgi:hypothetical protein